MQYDNSSAVNSFTVQGLTMWMDKATRVGLANSIAIEQEYGALTTSLWQNGHEFVFPIESALAMLKAVEMYALASYKVTQQHLAALNALDTIEAIEAYDFTIGYPEKLSL